MRQKPNLLKHRARKSGIAPPVLFAISLDKIPDGITAEDFKEEWTRMMGDCGSFIFKDPEKPDVIPLKHQPLFRGSVGDRISRIINKMNKRGRSK